MITIRIGETTIETTPRQDAGLDHWGEVDNQGQGKREPLTGEQLLVNLVTEALDRYAEQAGAKLEERNIEKFKAIIRNPEKAAEAIAFIEAKADGGK